MQTIKLSAAIALTFLVLMPNPAFATDPTQPATIPDPDATVLSTNVVVSDPSIGTAHTDEGTTDPTDWEYDSGTTEGATGSIHADAHVQWPDGTVRTLVADEDVMTSDGPGATDTLQMTFTVKPAA